ncbi:nodulation protein NolB [Rhizobium etli]|uniref:nodulation protein NolB n=1 Tax=Rhizobium etli TaxID=29449 RepID=UPI000383A68B|nr:nodulation protein NolB [Rhizobium etli]AGS25368.1 nodulation protein NolB [Rhizobium etli bv. mimosae str. Mim1]
MTIGVTPISINLVDGLSKVGSTSASGEQAQLESAFTDAVASIKNGGPSATAWAGPVPSVVEVQRATTQPSSFRDRALQTLSSVCRDKAVAYAARDYEVTLVNDFPLRPAESLPSEVGPEGMRMSGAPPGSENFEEMIASLRDVYNAVTQVSLVSKSISGATSSVNTLIKQG